jgi:outer membrane receptor protein involved in Fe transport
MKDPITSRRSHLLCNSAAIVGFVLTTTGAAAQTAPVPSFPSESAPPTHSMPALETGGQEAAASPDIIVTGSRIARTGFDASTPVAVIGAQDVTLSGTVNIENLLEAQPQFIASQEGGATSNTLNGQANVNLRGFGPTRNLVLVNGRRFAIYGPDQVTDLNTIPTSLIARTEVVTGGSSAVYGSDAITGVVNFILRDDFEGVEGRSQINIDEPTGTPVYNFDLTLGGNFADGRGNTVISGNYQKRNSITRGQRGDFAFDALQDGCVVAGSGSAEGAGTPFSPPAGQSCVAGGGELGFVRGGSGDIPNGRFSGIPAFGGTNAALNAAYAAAGLSALGSRGFTFNDEGTAARPQISPQDDFNNAPDNYLIQPLKRWMINSFSHYDFTDNITGYMELHYSNVRSSARLAPSNVGTPTLFNVNNPFLTPALQEVFRQLDLAETGTQTITNGTLRLTNAPGDGFANLTAGRRYSEVGPRLTDARRNVFRGAWGLRGDLGSLSAGFLSDLKYDAYYSYSQSEETVLLQNAISRSRLQASLLSVNGAAPLCNIFGQNISDACASAIRISATNSTNTKLQVASANLTGKLVSLPAGPLGFSVGAEWRKSEAIFNPDSFLASGDVAGFNPGLPTSGSIAAKEVFGEIRVPLIHDTPFIENLTANAAFRYSNYDLKGIGGVWTYLGGLDWRVSRDVAFRGQYQRAIRAPNVAELFGGLNRVVGVATDPCGDRGSAAERTDAVRAVCVATGVPAAAVFTAGIQPNSIIPADFGGNPNVGEEKSDTFTLGAVITPRFAPRLYLSVDYFNITLDGAISPLGGGLQNTLNLCYNVIQDASSEYCQAVRRDPNSGSINDPYVAQIRNANTGALRTSGIDFAAQYRFDLNFGVPLFGSSSTIDLQTNFTWLDDFTSTPVAAFDDIKNYCVGAHGSTCGQPLPEWRGTSRITWTIGDLALSARHRYIGSVTTDRVLVPQRAGAANAPTLSSFAYPVLGAQNYVDLSFTLQAMGGLQFYGGVNNLTNNNPPITTQGPNSNTWSATYDVLGREYFLGAALKF